MLSAIEEKRLARAAVERGAAAYIEKGLEPDELVHRLVRLMDAQRENDAQSMPK
jgi:AmiR/NasT family two-component response regulator